MRRREFVDAGRFLRGGHWLDIDYLWDAFEREDPLDAAAIVAGPTRLVVAATAGSAQLQFTQLWQSGTYKDTGPKRMVLAREGAGLLIARDWKSLFKIEDARRSADPVAPAPARPGVVRSTGA